MTGNLAMSHHVHEPMPRPTHIRLGMSSVELQVAKTKDALLYGDKVKCSCGRKGFIRKHGKGIRWFKDGEMK